MSTTQINNPKLRFIKQKRADGLDYVAFDTKESTGEKVQRIAARVGMALDRVLFYSGPSSDSFRKH